MSHSIFKLKAYGFEYPCDITDQTPIESSYLISDDPMGQRSACINDMLRIRDSFIKQGLANDLVDRMRMYLEYDVALSDAGSFRLYILSGIKDSQDILNKLSIEYVMLLESGTHLDDDDNIMAGREGTIKDKMIGRMFYPLIYFYDYEKDV
jgi:hypothetical protein